MQEKIELLKNINTDNARFVLKILEAYEKNQKEVKNKEKIWFLTSMKIKILF